MGLRERFREWYSDERNRQNLMMVASVFPLFLTLWAASVVAERDRTAGNIVFWGGFILWLIFQMVYEKLKQWEAARYLAFPKSHWFVGRKLKGSQDIVVKYYVDLSGEPEAIDVEELVRGHGLSREVAARLAELAEEVRARYREALEKLPEEARRRLESWRVYLVEFDPPVDLPELGKFHRALWVLPEEWERVFSFSSDLTMMYGPVIIRHPQAELAAFYIPHVRAYIDYYGEKIPVAFVASSGWHYATGAALEKPSAQELALLMDRPLLRENLELKHILATYEAVLEGYEEAARDQSRQVVHMIDYITKLRGDIHSRGLGERLASVVGERRALLYIGLALIVLGALYYMGMVP